MCIMRLLELSDAKVSCMDREWRDFMAGVNGSMNM